MGSALSILGSKVGPKTFFPSKPANVQLKQPAASKTISLRTLFKLHCSSLSSDFRPAWWLFKRVYDELFLACCVLTQHSGHLQTLYSVVGDFSTVDRVVYDR